jgi:hypothetical protein
MLSKRKYNRPDTPLAETPQPDYRNMPDTKRGTFKDKPYTPTAKDSAEYREGFKRGVEGKNKFFPSKVSIHGYDEAKERKLLPKQNKK